MVFPHVKGIKELSINGYGFWCLGVGLSRAVIYRLCIVCYLWVSVVVVVFGYVVWSCLGSVSTGVFRGS